ncbi:MAG TPA: hypothetical protein VFT22_31035 [Kofleriaceae bacterium]|nr:hypothetical protein [Kofleriaceae bacterium]
MKTPRPDRLVAMSAVERFVETAPIALRTALEDIEPLPDPTDRGGRRARPDRDESRAATLERVQERGLACLLQDALGIVVRRDALRSLHMCAVITRCAEAAKSSNCDDDNCDHPSRSHSSMLLQTLHRAGVLMG